jgi:DNA-directed RNA polymerase III subunit RPC1
MQLWTGKQLFSILLRPNRKSNVRVNFETPGKTYSNRNNVMCKNDGCMALLCVPMPICGSIAY